MAIIDNFTKEEIEQFVQESSSFAELGYKLGYKSKGKNLDIIKRRLEEFNISTEHFKLGKSPVKRTEENVFCENSTARQSTVRRWYRNREDIKYECRWCGISSWRGEKLVLQLDHVNGNNTDNRLENLRWLCPNCHSQTDTFCGKHLKKNHATSQGITKETPHYYCLDCGVEVASSQAIRCPECAAKARRVVERPSKEELYSFLTEHKGNFTKAGKYFGQVTDNTVRKWCRAYEIPYHSGDYKPYKPKQEATPSKPVIQLDKNTLEELRSFDSMRIAAQWLIDNGYSSSKEVDGIASHIGKVCKGERKTAYQFSWKNKE